MCEGGGRERHQQFWLTEPPACLCACVCVLRGCTQDAEVGDGTTTVVLLAAEFLRECKAFVEEGVHPQVGPGGPTGGWLGPDRELAS